MKVLDAHWLVGIHAVQAALEHDPANVTQLLTQKERNDRRLSALMAMAADSGIAIRRIARVEFDRRFPEQRHQGVAASYQAVPLADETALLKALPGWDKPLLLILDHLEDPRNFGACLRSAEAAGVDAVVFPRDRAVALTPTVRKVASGAAERLMLVQVTNLNRVLGQIQQAGVWLIGAVGQAEQTIYDMDLRGATGLVLGNEGRGLKRLTQERCDFLAHIPMHGQAESLNVSVAAGVFLFEAVRQRTRLPVA